MEKIFITGYGVKAPNGYNNKHFKESVFNGAYNLDVYESTLGKKVIVGRLPDKELEIYGNTRYSRVTKIGLEAAKEAIEMANIPKGTDLRIAVIIGSASGPTEEAVITNQKCFEGDFKKYPLLGIGLMSYHSISSAIIGELGVGSKAFTFVTGCNSGSDSIYMAKLLLDSNQADICIVGSADAPICEPVIYGFTKLRMIEADIDIEEAGIPFSNRNRFIMSEGAGVIVLEKESIANKRKVKKYGELINVDTNNDGQSAYKSDDSGLKIRELVSAVVGNTVPTYINSQALGLKENDNIELANRDVLFPNTPITSIKGVTGHPFGAMGILQIISSIISIELDIIPKTKTNEETKKLNIVTENIHKTIDTVCITTHGFGGNNACILVGR